MRLGVTRGSRVRLGFLRSGLVLVFLWLAPAPVVLLLVSALSLLLRRRTLLVFV